MHIYTVDTISITSDFISDAIIRVKLIPYDLNNHSVVTTQITRKLMNKLKLGGLIIYDMFYNHFYRMKRLKR